MVEVRRPRLDADARALAGVVQRLVDRDNGNAGGRIRLWNDSGVHQNIRGGAVLSTLNYPLEVKSATVNHVRVAHSSGTPDVLTVKDSGVTLSSAAVTGNATIGGTLGVTGNTSLGNLAVSGNATVTGTFGVTATTTLTGPLVANGSVTLGDAAADPVTVLGTASFAENVTLAKNLVVDTTTLVVDAVNNKVGVGMVPASTDAMLTAAGPVRITGSSPLPSTGAGFELYYDGRSVIQSYDRGGGTFRTLLLLGSSVDLYGGAGSLRVQLNSSGIGFFGATPVGQPATGGAADGTLASATTLVNSMRTGLRNLGLFS